MPAGYLDDCMVLGCLPATGDACRVPGCLVGVGDVCWVLECPQGMECLLGARMPTGCQKCSQGAGDAQRVPRMLTGCW